ncbi:MAG: hypothetical protein PHI83_04720 [Sphaerochaetaceae bacterium]|jgi:ABC-type tungstate transport system permease subunit|nr:hypothetical protein [Sphaerochaetaceae bacterium]
MALKRNTEENERDEMESLSEQKARRVFKGDSSREKKILTTFSIEPSFKENLENLFDQMGLGWAAGIRFALREFYKRNADE